MQHIEEQILSYPHLSVEKQQEVEAYVEAHPEWASLLQDVRSLESLIEAEDRSADALLRTYVVVQHLHPEEVPSALTEAFQRLERRMEEEADLRERAEAVRRRLEEAEASVDPVSHFEELTGHSLEPGADEVSTASETTAPSRNVAPDRGAIDAFRSFVDELLRLPLAVRGGGAAVALLLGTYAVLFVASEVSQSTPARLAAVDGSSQVVENYTSTATRSAVPSSDTLTADQFHIDALAALKEARTSTMGLFPRYDTEKLDRAERLFKKVLERKEAGSFLALEAQFYLGKVHLAQGEVEAALSNFETVVEREGRKATEARRIIETMQDETRQEE